MSRLVELETLLSPDRVKTDSAACALYGKDWTTYFDIKASGVVFPISTEEVQKLVLWARRNKIALVPSGGRTGLSGAAVATNGEIIVSFDRMNKILEFDPTDSTVRVEAGFITEELQKFAQEKGLFYPVDFAARGSSQIGGNIATNAGGIKVLRYGLTRDWIAGLRVVTGAGEILDLNQGLVKNATGFDFRHLMIGSEGTLGFITEATIKLAPAPLPLQVLFLGVSSLDAVMKIFGEFKKHVPLCAFEMLSIKALTKVLESTQLPRPFASDSPFYLVIEVENQGSSVEEKTLATFERCSEAGWITEGAMASNETQAKTFWRYREDISESLAKYSPYKNDISVRVSKVPSFLQELEKVFSENYPDWEVIWFGHIGDGNLHVNILRPPGMTKEIFVKECQKVDQLVFSCIKKLKGSISAEHGVGLTKKSFLSYSRSNEEIELMREVKKVFDPDNILNPGKIF